MYTRKELMPHEVLWFGSATSVKIHPTRIASAREGRFCCSPCKSTVFFLCKGNHNKLLLSITELNARSWASNSRNAKHCLKWFTSCILHPMSRFNTCFSFVIWSTNLSVLEDFDTSFGQHEDYSIVSTSRTSSLFSSSSTLWIFNLFSNCWLLTVESFWNSISVWLESWLDWELLDFASLFMN